MAASGDWADVTLVTHFSAGHRLASPSLSPAENQRVYGQCFRWHGHNYVVEVTVTGAIGPTTGMAVDMTTVGSAIRVALVDLVDHQDLGEVLPGTITTGEGLAVALWHRLVGELAPGTLKRVAVEETPRNRFEFEGEMAP